MKKPTSITQVRYWDSSAGKNAASGFVCRQCRCRVPLWMKVVFVAALGEERRIRW